MQRQRATQGILWSMVTGLVLLGGVAPVGAADAQKPAGQAPSTEKKASEKKSVKKGESRNTTPAAKSPAPKYASAETAAKAQACFGEAPDIESIQPDEGQAGDKVTITGRNFGPAECLRSLSFGPGNSATFKLDSPTHITATVPAGKRKGMAIMTVTTASGEDSKGFLLK
ncbi:MAG TPA: IPT/TIG domain-containing protein [Nitrospira sp.]|nr:IPT/TIG domain-containing protein [Nitrospira sp.]HQV11657.1 IPT/TIG domain-containing protein [Nitrospira sp.]